MLEIGLGRVDPVSDFGGARVPARNQNIDRQADAGIRAHRGVHGDQAYLEPIVEIGLETYGAFEHWLAVFMLTDLKVRRAVRVFGVIGRLSNRITLETPDLD